MSELREKAIEEVCRRGVATGDSDETMLGYFAERALLAEQQRDQARELLAQGVHAIITDIDGNHSASDEFPDDGCEICIWARKTHEFLAPSRADAQEES